MLYFYGDFMGKFYLLRICYNSPNRSTSRTQGVSYDMQDKRKKFYFLGQQDDDFEQSNEQYKGTDDQVGNAIDQGKHVHPDECQILHIWAL